MSDVNVLYTVTGAVVAGLALWTGYVLVTAPDAVDASKAAPKNDTLSERLGKSGPPESGLKKVLPDLTPPPATVDIIPTPGKTAPIVILPVMRHRLDSHSEISDDGDGDAPAVTGLPEKRSASGPPLSLTSAIGQIQPETGPNEMAAIVDQHGLFLLADGRGERVGSELVSALVVTALAEAFGADTGTKPPPSGTGPQRPPRAERLRRAILAADTEVKGRAATIDTGKVGVLAAHFAPDNRHLYLATRGRDRAYRLRAQDVTHLNKPGLGDPSVVELVSFETLPGDVYVFGSDAAFLALGDELRTVLTFDPSIDKVAAHFVAAATREAKTAGMTAIVVRVGVSHAPPDGAA